MKEEDLTRAINLKKLLDYRRELLRFANNQNVKLKVTLEDNCDHGRIRDMNYIFDDSVIEELKAKVITGIEKSINEVLLQIEKL